MQHARSILAPALVTLSCLALASGCIGNRRPRSQDRQPAQQGAPTGREADAKAEAEPEPVAEPANDDTQAKAEAKPDDGDNGYGQPHGGTNYGVPTGENSPRRGANGALVTIIEFGGLTCPDCKKNMQTLRSIQVEHPEVAWVFRHFPTEDIVDRGAARAGAAAQRQDGFWKLREKVTGHEDTYSGDVFYGFVEELGMDLDEFKQDLRDPEIAKQLQLDKAVAEVFRGDQEPPFLFVNGRFIQGAPDKATLEKLIEEERAKARAFQGKPAAGEDRYEAMRKTWRGAALADKAGS